MRTNLARAAIALAGSLTLLLPGCAHTATPRNTQADWHATLNQRLPEYGHRNIIGIVDAAYPAQTRAGVEMITADANQIEVVRAVLSGINARDHVRPVVLTDAELTHIAEADAPGITAYRDALAAALNGTPASSLPHDKIIATVDDTAQTFKVLLIKTPLVLPYTSVFIRLECGYWSDDAEKRLREAISAAAPQDNHPIVHTDRADPDIFPESWRSAPIDASAGPLDPALTAPAQAVVAAALAKYPAPLLRDNLKAVYVVGTLRYRGIAAGGTNSRSSVYLAFTPRFSEAALAANFHAEFSSILLRNHKPVFDHAAWLANCPEGRNQDATGGVDAIKSKRASLAMDPKLLEQGFFHEYATSGLENDFNSYASRLFTGDPFLWDAMEKHPRVKAKADVVLRFYESLHPELSRAYFTGLSAAK